MIVDSRDFRDSLGRFATGVCVVTVQNEQGEPLGLTVNSFASVSLDPPLILWSLQNSSDVFSIYSNAQRFAINILSAQQRDLAGMYAQRGGHSIDPAQLEDSTSDYPILQDSLASMQCEVHTTHDGGDHLIIVGKVLAHQRRAVGEPLLFYSGDYGTLAS